VENGALEGLFEQVVMCAVKGAFFARVRYPAGKLSLQPEALGAAQEVTNGLKHFEKRPPWEVSVPRGPQRAANIEQAPKRVSWEPTRHNNGEGRRLGRSERREQSEDPPG
jgi:hypothetical protein